MAHECPDCGEVCYDGGDIDDMVMSGTAEELRCAHCPDDVDNDNDDDARSCDHPSYHEEAGGMLVCSDCGSDMGPA